MWLKENKTKGEKKLKSKDEKKKPNSESTIIETVRYLGTRAKEREEKAMDYRRNPNF